MAVGQPVSTEWGPGVVTHSSARRVVVQLATGDVLNVATGTPGYSRLQPV